MEKIITSDTDLFLKDSPAAAKSLMTDAVEDIDKKFGKGYAKEHPELVGAYMQTGMINFATATICKRLETLTEALNGLKD